MKIAIIGNGKFTKKYGSRIDKADIIIRFNGARIEGYQDQVGSRTDILALAGATSLSYMAEAAKIDTNILKETGQVIFSGRKRNENYEKILLKKKAVNNANISNLIFQYVGFDCFMDLVRKVEPDYEIICKLPSTGMNVLCYILYQYNYSDGKVGFNIYGFDNFESGHYFDNERRNNSEFHDLGIEMAIIDYLKNFKNIRFFN